jgi:(p)ppGpp synthase/HD superfamily hydrolase
MFVGKAYDLVLEHDGCVLGRNGECAFHNQRRIAFEARDEPGFLLVDLVPPVVVAIAFVENIDGIGFDGQFPAFIDVFAPAEVALIRKACEFAAPLYHDEVDVTGASLLQHALGSASILIGLHMDHETIAAAALHAVPNHLEDWRVVLTARFGANVTRLVGGISDMERLRHFSEVRNAAIADKQEAAQQVEGLRKMLLLQDRVYVFTPQGKVIDLPKGATPVDFAYVVHTDIGHRTRGAKLDGNIVPLNTKLQTGQRVEILTTKQGGPSRDWLSLKLGFLQSSRARARVRHWFSEQNVDDSISQGRTLLDRELHRVGSSTLLKAGSADINQEKLAQKLHYNKLDDLLAALGRGDITPRRVSLAIGHETPINVQRSNTRTIQTVKGSVLIEGEGNLVSRTAKCCNPTKLDDIIGYVTRDRGITIHRHDCPFVLRMSEEREDRLLNATWSTK